MPAPRRGAPRTGAAARSARSSAWSQRRGRTTRGPRFGVHRSAADRTASAASTSGRVPISSSRRAAQSVDRVTSATVHRRPRTRTRLPGSLRSRSRWNGIHAREAWQHGCPRTSSIEPALRLTSRKTFQINVLWRRVGISLDDAAGARPFTEFSKTAHSAARRHRGMCTQGSRSPQLAAGSWQLRSTPSRRRANRAGHGAKR